MNKCLNLLKKQARLVALVIILIPGIFACQNRDAERGQFNNNSTGADRDHTTVAKDTVSTSGLTADSVATPEPSGGTPTQ